MEEGKILSLPSPGGEEKGVLRSPWTESSGSTFTKNFYPSSNVLNDPRHSVCSLLRKLRETLSPNKVERQSPPSETIIRKLEDYPLGYPRQAAFADSDESFMLYRRFGNVHARLLLHLQDEIREMEAQLYNMDLRDNKSEEGQGYLQSRELDEERLVIEDQESRSQLLTRMEKKTRQYGQLLLQSQQLVAMNRPPERDQDSVRSYIEKNACLVERESRFAYEKEDLVTLRPGRDHSFVDAFVERMLRSLPCRPIQFIFCSKETAGKSDDPKMHYYTRSRINAFVTMIIMSIIVLLLVVPIWLLYHLSVTLSIQRSNIVCIGVLLVSTLIFSAVLSLFTKARRHEILAASAGYCAVLVVFVGNLGNVGMNH